MELLTICLIFMRFGLLCFGGGNALVPLYIDDLVVGRGWMTLDEFGNLMSIAQITPGPIGINSATFFGYRFGGTTGALLATVSLLTPSVVIMLFVSKHIETMERNRYIKSLIFGVAPATVALMLMAFHEFAKMSLRNGGEWRPFAFVICAATVWALRCGKVKITTIILASAALGALFWGLTA